MSDQQESPDTVDWSEHRPWDKPVRCRLTLREVYNGRPMLERLRPFMGVEMELEALWLMEEGDNYPGEWALSTHRGIRSPLTEMGLSWIASGDVTPIHTMLIKSDQS